jgi:glycosyltransferase involved in cell wall biosynthesis
VSIKVSVVVPVYNPGDDIGDCIRTLVDEQSLPTEEYEVIFVDDGSTDATPARLDALAAEHDHVRVEHIENSGWPGRPRNVGTDMARGDFVYFVDNDDYVAPEALERLHALAVRDDADVVVGKVVGQGKDVPKNIFTRNRSRVTLADWVGMLWLLSPHKLFRRAFLDEHGIRFPEGRRRLEDHVFVTHAYLHAQAISVLADYTCYYWVRRGDTNASYRPFEPAMYYANVREVLDLVDEHTEPGEFRDQLYLRWYRGKVLGRAGGKPFLRYSEEYRRERYDEIHRLVVERFDPRLDAHLPLSWRPRAQLVRAGDYEGVKALAAYETALSPVARVRALDRAEDDVVELSIDARFGSRGGGSGLTFERREGGLHWTPPPELTAALADTVGDVGDDAISGDLRVFVRSAADGSEFPVPGKWSVDLAAIPDAPERVRPVVRGTARLSGRTGAAGAPLPPGEWDVLATLTVAGFRATGRVHRKRGGDPVRFRVGRDGVIDDERASPKTRMAARWPRAAKLARRAGL